MNELFVGSVRFVVEFSPPVTSFVEGRRWHASQSIEPLADGRLRLTLQVSIDWALKGWIMSFGPHARVIAPGTLADDVRDDLAQAEAQYE